MRETDHDSIGVGAETKPGFEEALRKLINEYCMENHSNTPDYILAEYISAQLFAFDKAVADRENYYGRFVHAGKEN